MAVPFGLVPVVFMMAPLFKALPMVAAPFELVSVVFATFIFLSMVAPLFKLLPMVAAPFELVPMVAATFNFLSMVAPLFKLLPMVAAPPALPLEWLWNKYSTSANELLSVLSTYKF